MFLYKITLENVENYPKHANVKEFARWLVSARRDETKYEGEKAQKLRDTKEKNYSLWQSRWNKNGRFNKALEHHLAIWERYYEREFAEKPIVAPQENKKARWETILHNGQTCYYTAQQNGRWRHTIFTHKPCGIRRAHQPRRKCYVVYD